MKQCPKCLQNKEWSEFSKEKNRPDGHSWQCKACNSEYRKTPERVAVRRKRDCSEAGKRSSWFRQIKYKYGLNKEQYLTLISKTPNCEICNELFKGNPHIDHCHTTGKIRGLLCGNCNRAIGMLKEDKKILLSAIQYLDKNRTN